MKQKIIDLTHSLTPEIATFDGPCGFNLVKTLDYGECAPPNLFRVQKITEMMAGVGTHMDAPAHCIQNGKTIDVLELKNLVTNCVVINIETSDENYIARPDVVEKFEQEHGEIKQNSFVIFYTGWDKYWETPEKFRNGLSFPSIHEDTAKLLLERNISGIGIDTLSADAKGEDFPVHRAILGAGKYLVENIANAKDLPPTGAKIFIMPIKIKGGTEAPIRLIALV